MSVCAHVSESGRRQASVLAEAGNSTWQASSTSVGKSRPSHLLYFNSPFLRDLAACSKRFKIAEIHKNREVIGHLVLYTGDPHQTVLCGMLFNTIQSISKTVHSLSILA